MLLQILMDFNWTQLLQPQFYIEHGGLWLIMFVVFAETGLFAGFFLPGDSLLFVAGIYSTNIANEVIANQNELVGLLLLIALISFAGILGNATGYWFGKKVGQTMYEWKENFFYKRRFLIQAHDFYEKHGGGAIVVASFIPLVRTFAPIVAGIVDMNHKKFTFYNVVGCIAWVSSMLIGGHFLQKWILAEFDFDLKSHLEVIVLGIVFITTAPVIIKLLFHKPKS